MTLAADDVHALAHEQLTPRDPTARLQAQMRRDQQGHLVCERCGGKVRYGWVYHFGSIVLATCARAQCAPQPQPPWTQGVRFA